MLVGEGVRVRARVVERSPMSETPEPPAQSRCPACETVASPRAHHCPSCGEPLTEQALTARSSNHLVVFLLVVMGLGFGAAYYMRARQRAVQHPPQPAHSTPDPGDAVSPPDAG
jgi:hypothetical protein